MRLFRKMRRFYSGIDKLRVRFVEGTCASLPTQPRFSTEGPIPNEKASSQQRIPMPRADHLPNLSNPPAVCEPCVWGASSVEDEIWVSDEICV